MGGWLHKCGHFHPSDFVQVAYVNQECYDCQYAKKLLEQAKHLRRRKVSAEPDYKVTPQTHICGPAKKRQIDCRAGY